MEGGKEFCPDIDIEEWSLTCKIPGSVERMLQELMDRSCGSLRTLRVANLRDEMIFHSIAEKAGSLEKLRLRRCKMSDSTVERIAEKLSSITFLDLNNCGKIGSRALEAIGKNCKSLVGLCWNNHSHPPIIDWKYPRDAEAHAIAKTMPGLKHLEMGYNLTSTKGVLAILRSCRELEFLNLRGCWDVRLNRKYLAEKFPKLKLLGPEPGVLDYNWNNSEYSEGEGNHEMGEEGDEHDEDEDDEMDEEEEDDEMDEEEEDEDEEEEEDEDEDDEDDEMEEEEGNEDNEDEEEEEEERTLEQRFDDLCDGGYDDEYARKLLLDLLNEGLLEDDEMF